MQPYENMLYATKYGHYDENSDAGYILNDGKTFPPLGIIYIKTEKFFFM